MLNTPKTNSFDNVVSNSPNLNQKMTSLFLLATGDLGMNMPDRFAVSPHVVSFYQRFVNLKSPSAHIVDAQKKPRRYPADAAYR